MTKISQCSAVVHGLNLMSVIGKIKFALIILQRQGIVPVLKDLKAVALFMVPRYCFFPVLLVFPLSKIKTQTRQGCTPSEGKSNKNMSASSAICRNWPRRRKRRSIRKSRLVRRYGSQHLSTNDRRVSREYPAKIVPMARSSWWALIRW